MAWCASRRQTVEPRAPAVGSRSARGARRPGTEGGEPGVRHVDGRSRRRRGRERGRRDERVWGIGDRGGGSERGGQRWGFQRRQRDGTASSSGMLVLGSGNAGATGSSGRLVFSSGTAAGGNSGEVLVGSGSTTGGCGGGVRASVGCSASGGGGPLGWTSGQRRLERRMADGRRRRRRVGDGGVLFVSSGNGGAAGLSGQLAFSSGSTCCGNNGQVRAGSAADGGPRGPKSIACWERHECGRWYGADTIREGGIEERRWRASAGW